MKSPYVYIISNKHLFYIGRQCSGLTIFKDYFTCSNIIPTLINKDWFVERTIECADVKTARRLEGILIIQLGDFSNCINGRDTYGLSKRMKNARIKYADYGLTILTPSALNSAIDKILHDCNLSLTTYTERPMTKFKRPHKAKRLTTDEVYFKLLDEIKLPKTFKERKSAN